MISHGHHPSIVGTVTDSGPVPIGRIAAIHSDITYADPNLIVLLFLFGFCLLYALVLVVDALAARGRTVPEDGSDPESGAPGRDIHK